VITRDRRTLETEIRALIGDLVEAAPDSVDLSASLYSQGVDSLRLIVLRERLQAERGIVFSDDEWMNTTTAARILEHAATGASTPIAPAADAETPRWPANPVGSPRLTPGLAVEPLEIGMPLTGRNNLAETPLLQYLGDQRWRHLSRVLDVPSRAIADDEGERLYATFFYVEIAFPSAAPMASFGENDRFVVVSTLERFGGSMLDGVSYLVPANHAGPVRTTPFNSVAEANAAGVPAVRLSNIFVKKFEGAAWLKKGRPAHARFNEVPATAEAPDSYAIAKEAEQSGQFPHDPTGWTAMTAGPVEREYHLVPDRDLNGAGLVYFANYPMFLDICERDVLATGDAALDHDLIDRRTLIRRRSAYLNNASSRDRLRVEMRPWYRLQSGPISDVARSLDLHLRIDARMYRKSDNRLMMVSGVHKVIQHVTAAEVPFAV
jgi:probable biosynthetic protein (TIGR04098 family)